MQNRAGLIQFTAVDDCTRYRVLALFPRRTAANTLIFLDQVIDEMPFPIQRIQSDRGREFFAVKVQKKMMESCIKFRSVKPGSPHLNGKVGTPGKSGWISWCNSNPDKSSRSSGTACCAVWGNQCSEVYTRRM